MRITAAQHVSGVLRSDQSPRGQAGHQTLLSTGKSLAQDEIRLIESRVTYSSEQDVQAKWQAYTLPGQRHVISRVVTIPEPDEFGRGGRYFAHSLVFNASDWRRLDDAPFDLLRPKYFFSSLEEVLASEGLETGKIPDVEVAATGEWVEEASELVREWPGEQLNHLVMLVSDPRQLTVEGHYVALLGSDAQILDALKVAFLLASSPARELCSFDTNASGCEWQPNAAFWGRGFPAEAKVETLFVIDAARRRVEVPASSSLRAAGFFPEELSAPLRKSVLARLNQPQQNLLRRLIDHQYAAFIGEPVYQALLHDDGLPLAAADLEVLNPLGKTHRGLGLLLALKSGNELQRLEMLAAMKLDEYQQRVRELRARSDFQPWQVFSPGYIPTWFELCRDSYGMDDIFRAVNGVAEHGSKAERQQLESVSEGLKPDQRQELRRWLKSSPHRLSNLDSALERAASSGASGQTTKPSGSLWRRLKGSFTKTDGRG
jgi:hypothetical protein